jgi:hypothetical protein
MGGAYSKHGEDSQISATFWLESLKEIDSSEHKGVEGMVILK